MEFLVEFLLETLGDAFLEYSIESAVDHRLPKWLRVLVLTATALIFAAIFGIILLVGIAVLRYEGSVWMTLLMFALDAGLAFLLFFKVRKVLRKRSRK